ncbi:hypothetical protein BDV11DRAFT_185288 [Aspergillus similis]
MNGLEHPSHGQPRRAVWWFCSCYFSSGLIYIADAADVARAAEKTQAACCALYNRHKS